MMREAVGLVDEQMVGFGENCAGSESTPEVAHEAGLENGRAGVGLGAHTEDDTSPAPIVSTYSSSAASEARAAPSSPGGTVSP
jgi:hypothetical protein